MSFYVYCQLFLAVDGLNLENCKEVEILGATLDRN